MKQIAFYGKGGIGKSTTVCNIAAALADEGKKVMVIGCDPKHDCTSNLRGGEEIPTILDTLREKGMEKLSLEDAIEGRKIEMDEIIHKGYNGIYCIEAGGPKPGYGCAGRGVIVAIDLLKKMDIYEELGVDIVLYDVLGDVVCGGFAMPLRMGLAKQIYVVTSSDYMAMYAANNICRGMKEFAKKGGSRLGGLIYNVRGSLDAYDLVEEMANKIGTEITGKIPNSMLIAEGEIEGKTVIEYAPDSEISSIYRELARKIYENDTGVIPNPLENEEIMQIGQAVKERIKKMRN
ncbi:MAG: nitrogenase iron protein NifH [Methanothermococcus sp.]|uniref:nitrogenase iron protein n=1 Tax=Methanothermococcus TaxID=155862 RepID=UPI00036113FA|nr:MULTISPECIES: nitrogenase iron protein [Methanothermococcus]MDK2790235.1 nitrogenase iron protein NifH [Methanothermococcus sp.]MDK2987162.1 nitrogenase iron protein NifH [Methanothermococcus sp.]